jgi:hypothetical protein
VSPPIDSAEVVARSANQDLGERDIKVVEQRIAQVLGRVHQSALAAGTPGEARAILNVAQTFADELAAADSGFDRMAFLEAVMEDAS